MQLHELNKKFVKARNALNKLTLSCVVLNNAIGRAIDVTDITRFLEDPPTEEMVHEAIGAFDEAFPQFADSLEAFEDAMDNIVGGAR